VCVCDASGFQWSGRSGTAEECLDSVYRDDEDDMNSSAQLYTAARYR